MSAALQPSCSLRRLLCVLVMGVLLPEMIVDPAQAQSQAPLTEGLPHPSGKILTLPRERARPDTMDPGHSPQSVAPFDVPSRWLSGPDFAPGVAHWSAMQIKVPKGHVAFWNTTTQSVRFSVGEGQSAETIELGGRELITWKCGSCASPIAAEITSPKGTEKIALAEKQMARIYFAESLWRFAKSQ